MPQVTDRFISRHHSSNGQARLYRDGLLLIALPTITYLLVPPEWPRWTLMWMLALAVYVGCKWLTWSQAETKNIPIWQQAAYLAAWPGLDAVAFLRNAAASPTASPHRLEWCFAWSKFLVGIGLILVSARWSLALDPYLVGWIGMVGIVFTLHFGLFHLLSCVWRSAGIDARPLMNWPLLSVSISEFWGVRWNLAFRDITHRFLFRPLTSRFGPRVALTIGFFVSGLVHELVITVPAGGGYGGPTLFFLIQGLALFLERSAGGRKLGLGTGLRGWLFVAFVTLLPVSLLFPPAFVEGIIVSFLQSLEAN